MGGDINNTQASNSIPAATSGSRSKLLSTNFKNFLSKPATTHPQKALTVQLFNADVKSNSNKNAGAGSDNMESGTGQDAALQSGVGK
jgi:hypothetical protein